MNVLIIGRGGREHVMAWKAKQSQKIDQVYVTPGNDGMKDVATTAPIDENDLDGLVRFAKEKNIKLTIVGPEAPLIDGVVNRFQEENLPIFGPTKEAALIEGSKQFAKGLMKKYHIPTAAYESFINADEAKNYVRQTGVPIVIKADGLAAGKGVIIAETIAEADTAIEAMLGNQKFGEASQTIVIEEFLTGEEFSLMAFVNGTAVYPMDISQDHKRAFDQDQGPNTGGMGAYSPVPQIDEAIKQQAIQSILQPMANALAQEGRSFRGILYAGLINTSEGPKVIEFNARFGDPEAQVVLPRLENDFMTIIEAVMQQQPINLTWSDEAMVGVVLASQGYPGNYEKGNVIPNLTQINEDILTFHAGTKHVANEWQTNGGRLLLLASKQPFLQEARERVYKEMEKLKSKDTFYRTDIARSIETILK
ncbi:phosphoribosylamine--glycine ligase [Tenuibacillus multivorans]|uniref:Phosphoribosylamine--glycine ligase n=1 Tax=Tenuibacillus multivorans TaxID=237069 RepID=A0A1H0F994_9BACI|nr:phosphoribosylamine--glycine ligase [Tenuibacillus multivorans]GEL78024.1 phosphoribosylamine--glycine ligase [Tenuibacillus multivorans]SDN91141.1 phosphoribosylamine--glycine ligase [Tenuibacillus multivorans]